MICRWNGVETSHDLDNYWFNSIELIGQVRVREHKHANPLNSDNGDDSTF